MMDYSALTISAIAALAAIASVVNSFITNRRREDKESNNRAHGYLREEMHECHERMDEIECNYKDEFRAVRHDMHGLGEHVQRMGQQVAELTVNIKHLFKQQGIEYQKTDQ